MSEQVATAALPCLPFIRCSSLRAAKTPNFTSCHTKYALPFSAVKRSSESTSDFETTTCGPATTGTSRNVCGAVSPTCRPSTSTGSLIAAPKVSSR